MPGTNAGAPLRVGLVLISGAGAGAKGTAGTETVARRQFGLLRGRVDVELATDRRLHPALEEIVSRVHRVPARSLAGVAAFPVRLARLARRRAFDVVLSEGPVPIDLLSAVACRLAGVPHVVRRHVVVADVAGGRWKKALYRGLDRACRAAGARYVFLTSEQRRREGLPDDSIARNGVDLSEIRPSERAPGAPLTIGMVGQFIPAKDWPAFFEVFAALKREAPDARALAVGDGPTRDEAMRAAGAESWGGDVEFTGNLADIREALRKIDVMVLTSRREGLSMACLEALAAGVPVVTTPTSGAAEIVGDGEGGAITSFQPGVEAVAEIRRLHADPDARRRARERAEALFGLEEGAENLFEVLQHAAREGRAQ